MTTTVNNIGLHDDLKRARAAQEKRTKTIQEREDALAHARKHNLKYTETALNMELKRLRAAQELTDGLVNELETALGVLPLEPPKKR